ncbi:hypothetical protein F5Y03DRAFT_348607 [Xylaria venustula]|nr:hypothetical protein F5Y03DRAFT_348607 [Xylaria venustula]
MKRTIIRLARPGRSNAGVQTQSPSGGSKKPVSWSDTTAEIEPGQHVIAACRQHNFAFPSQLSSWRGLVKPNPFNLIVTGSQKHCFLHQSMRYFDKVEHPFTKSMLDIYIEKKKEPLWMSGFSYGAGAFPNKVASRKITHALRDALMAAGYDRFGRRVPIDGKSSAIAELYGTVRVVSTDPLAVCNAKFADLLECAKKIISFAEIKLRRDKNGQHFEDQLQQKPAPARVARESQRRQPDDQRRRHRPGASRTPYNQ